MAKFNAEECVEAMEWDFTKYGGGKGVIPEPSDLQMERFLRKYTILVTQAAQAAATRTIEVDQGILDRLQDAEEPILNEDGTPKMRVLTLEQAIEVMKQIDVVGTDTSPAISEAMLDLMCTITKNSPSKAQIKKLPNRPRGAFFGWLMGQLTNPEYSAAVTRPALSLVTGGASS